MKKLFVTVVRCRESKQTIDGKELTFYYSKLHNITKDDVFGKSVEQHIHVKGSVELKVGTALELDMSKYIIQEHPSSWADETSGEMINANLKWLHLKSDVKKVMD